MDSGEVFLVLVALAISSLGSLIFRVARIISLSLLALLILFAGLVRAFDGFVRFVQRIIASTLLGMLVFVVLYQELSFASVSVMKLR